MPVLVTGSAGFVGRALVATLKMTGHHGIGIDVNPKSRSDEFHRHDLTTRFDMPLRFDVCVHLASSVGGILFNLERADIITYNDLINTNVARILEANGCGSLVFFPASTYLRADTTFPTKSSPRAPKRRDTHSQKRPPRISLQLDSGIS